MIPKNGCRFSERIMLNGINNTPLGGETVR
jgi:hypothetical protein